METLNNSKFQNLSEKEMEQINGGKIIGWNNVSKENYSTGGQTDSVTGYHQEYQIFGIGTGRYRDCITD